MKKSRSRTNGLLIASPEDRICCINCKRRLGRVKKEIYQGHALTNKNVAWFYAPLLKLNKKYRCCLCTNDFAERTKSHPGVQDLYLLNKGWSPVRSLECEL